jgi:putative N-acetylmannosamine-6-phosphate epimerase
LENTLDEVAAEGEAVVALDGTEPERDAPLVEEAVAALDGAEPEGGLLAKAAKGLPDASENAVVDTAGGGIVGRAEPKSDAPSVGT